MNNGVSNRGIADPRSIARSNLPGASIMPFRSRKRFPIVSLGLVLAMVVFGWAGSPPARAGIVVSGSFGPNGDVGFPNSPPNLSISFGADGQGQIFQMDAFVSAAGQNWNNNGTGFGTSAQLSYGPPTGLVYTFGATQPNADQLLLNYQFVNNTGSALSSFQFMPYVNPFFGFTIPNDYGTVTGSTSTNPTLGPQTYQIDDANSGTIFTNVLFGKLDSMNHAPSATEGTNVAMALGFTVSTLAAGQSVAFDVLLSDNGTSIGSLALTDQNPNYPGDTLTMSGVPEPSGLVLLGLGSLGVFCAGALSRRKRVRGTATGPSA
jgi:hypothetical protein